MIRRKAVWRGTLGLRAVACVAALMSGACAKQVRFTALPAARGGEASARVELTFDRNNTVELKLSNVPEPSALDPRYTRYVLWAATPDRQRAINIGQLRVEANRAELKTLTPLRSFVLFVTAEATGDAMTPGETVVFETGRIDW